MKFDSAVELIKQMLYVSSNVVWQIVKNIAEPIYTVTIKILLMALVVFAVAHFVPHGLLFLKDVSYLGWVTVIILYNLITTKYQELSGDERVEEVDEEEEYDDEGMPIEIQGYDDIDAPPKQELKPAPNVVIKHDPNTSTRE